MANPYVRQTARRKLVYLGAVLALFTAALLHRQFNVKPLGERLQLRETTRGEVDLTSSALRLTLSGSRGMAVTFLWMQANQLQDRGEWHELELVVDSITKLQPYFITPWEWQSWNIAYNVGRELDRPFDKYYYVSRGTQLLAEGERRNQGNEQFPGSPDMRMQIGKMYEDKIGLSDERNAMRSLFELSCIDPRKRDPRRFWNPNAAIQNALNPEQFRKFCEDEPRLVRRLADKLNYRTPFEIYKYLWNNRDVPMRFEEYDWRERPDFSIEAISKVKSDPLQQFPLLPVKPGREDPTPPNPRDYDLTPEGNDVFVVARTWMYYAQDPFPPNTGDPSDTSLPEKDPWKYRLAKRPPLYMCRGFPSISQMHIAEQLQVDGWFVREGWEVPNSFELTNQRTENPVIGADKAHLDSHVAWERSYQVFRNHGIRTGLYFPPAEEAELNQKAQAYRVKYRMPPYLKGGLPPGESNAIKKSYEAHYKLYVASASASTINYDARLERCETERDIATARARRVLFLAKSAAQAGERRQSLRLHEQFWPMWLNVMLKHPRFAENDFLSQDMIEDQHRYLRAQQRARPEFFQNLCIGVAQLALQPHLPLGDPNFKLSVRNADGKLEEMPLLDETDRLNIIPIRKVHGPLEMMRVLDIDDQVEAIVRPVLALWPQGGNPVFFSQLPLQNWILAKQESRDRPLEPGWRLLVSDAIVNPVRERLGLTK